ncbi:DUF397 domain-containing protein [Streptomyces nitrosporeus]|uniref:DUF397 domain-containing protein n=1 Tax=Streptomyces nitrosporeus TaxID=28894 RepID=A0A5J6FDU8_9ACTN|nr:DUF397 domain-containing protein [Streptomyces nitrosporeus]QEU74216.1 DUF397 domain-containing protein [Streptomyces nitrosporeus]GGY97253.1 hypothetical protein GCM10010327_29970 [Streptomyces nitrosporeus]
MSTSTVVGPFVKSTASGQQDACVEVAPLSDGGRAVRDSKNQHGPRLFFTATQWTAFTDSVKADARGTA